MAKYARKPLNIDAGYDHPTGIISLKIALADYIGLVRGVDTQTANVLILNSTQAAIDLLCRVLLGPADRTWVEDPGYSGIRYVMSNCGASIRGIAVDSEGFSIPQNG